MDGSLSALKLVLRVAHGVEACYTTWILNVSVSDEVEQASLAYQGLFEIKSLACGAFPNDVRLHEGNLEGRQKVFVGLQFGANQ